MTPAFEATIARELGQVRPQRRPVQEPQPIYWCASAPRPWPKPKWNTNEHVSPSIYVRFRLIDPPEKADPSLAGRNVSFIIWTTTPWTIPANLAVALNPEFEYAPWKWATKWSFWPRCLLLDRMMDYFGLDKNYQVLATLKAADLEGLRTRHPLYDRESRWCGPRTFTLEQGTAACTPAPATAARTRHRQRYGLETYSPVDDNGRFTKERGPLRRTVRLRRNEDVIAKIKEAGGPGAPGKDRHQYPTCWRCPKSRSSTAHTPNGSSPWKRPACGPRPWTRSTMCSGFRAGAGNASIP